MITVIAIIVAIFAIGGISKWVYKMNTEITLHSDVYEQLLALDNNPTLALTSQQAKAIIPILEQIKSNANTTGANADTALTKQSDLEKSIYTLLTQPQYFSLLSGQTGGMMDGASKMIGAESSNHMGMEPSFGDGRDGMHGKGGHGRGGGHGDDDYDHHDGGHFGGKGGRGDQMNAIDQVLPDMVIKQLASKVTN